MRQNVADQGGLGKIGQQQLMNCGQPLEVSSTEMEKGKHKIPY